MDGSAFFLLFLVFAAAAVVFAYVGYQRKLARIRDIRSLALAHGLDFAIQDPFGTIGEPFSLLQAGDGRGVENVLWGTWRVSRSARSTTGTTRSRRTRTATRRGPTTASTACSHRSTPRARPPRIGEENLLTRIAGALSFDDIRFESEEFNRRFHVEGRDAHFATALCDARMMDWLLANGDGHAFEVVGARLLCSRRLVEPAALLDLFATARAFRERIPPVVSSLYPKR